MKLTVIKSPTTKGVYSLAIKEIENLSKNGDRVFVVVPDRATLITELSIINNLKSKGILNFQVTTLNLLAKKLNTNNKATLSSFGGQLLIKKILTKNKQNLLCFNKMSRNMNFCVELYKTIEQFKASNINVLELKNFVNKTNFASLKIKDILLIWEEYEKIITSNFSDGFSNLNCLKNNIKFDDEIKNSCFIFLNYQNATNQAIEIINQIIRTSKQTFVGLPTEVCNQNNAEIYENNVLTKIRDFSLANNIEINEIENPRIEYLEKNLFSFNLGTKKENSTNIKLLEFNNIEREITYCAKTIINKVFEGKRFNDFNIIVCDVKNYLYKIEEIFTSLQIPYFVDAQNQIMNHALVKFILQIINCFQYNFQSKYVLDLIKNYYYSADLLQISDFENYVFKFNIEGAMFFTEFKNENAESVRKGLKIIIEYYNNFKKLKNVKDFINLIFDCLECFDYENKTLKLSQELETCGDLKNSKITNQIIEKIKEVFNDIEQILNEEDCEISVLKDLILCGFSNKSISLVPIKTNSVYVGDLAKSYFMSDKINVVLGASFGCFPQTIKDVGIVSDEEAEVLKLKNKLDPSIKSLNRRAMFKCYEICCNCEDLIISFSNQVKDQIVGESLAAIDLKNMFELSINEISNIELPSDFVKQCCISQNEINRLVLINKNKVDKNENVLEFSIINVLKDLVNTNFNFMKEENVNSNLLSNNEIAITTLEKYFECPLKSFLSNILKLKERETVLIKALDIGNLYHEFVYEFVKGIKSINDKNYLEKSIDVFEAIFSKPEYEVLKQVPQNLSIINNLKKEIKKIALVLLTYEKESLFKPKFLETAFGDGKILKSPMLKMKTKIYHLKGKIDRVDVCDEHARVIDYKTGKDKFSLKDIFYGKKIQLISYLMCVVENNYIPVGTYYLPLNVKINSNKFTAKLNGITLKDLKVARESDINLKPGMISKFINLRLKDDFSFDGRVGFGTLLSQSQLNNLMSYVQNLSCQAIKELECGYVAASPLYINNCSCDYCQFKGLFNCKDAKPRLTGKVDKTSFSEGGGDDE